MRVGDLHAGAIVFHARWGLGRVVRVEEAYAIGKFGMPGAWRRHKLAMNDEVAVWVRGAQANQKQEVAA